MGKKYEEEDEEKLSKYNQGLPQLYRLDDLWKKFHHLMLAGRLIESNWVLDRIFGELVADSPEGTSKKFKEFRKKIIDNIKKLNMLYLVLLTKEEFLRRLQNKEGKGTAYISEEDDMID